MHELAEVAITGFIWSYREVTDWKDFLRWKRYCFDDIPESEVSQGQTGQHSQQCQQWCQPCKTHGGPEANRKPQSAVSAPELTQAVPAINLLKCAYLVFYELPPLIFMHSYFPLSNTKTQTHEGTVAGHGLKRLKQTHSSSFRWWDMRFFPLSSFFLHFYHVDWLPWCRGSKKWLPSCWRWGTFLGRMAVWCLTSLQYLSSPCGAGCRSLVVPTLELPAEGRSMKHKSSMTRMNIFIAIWVGNTGLYVAKLAEVENAVADLLWKPPTSFFRGFTASYNPRGELPSHQLACLLY